MDPCRRGITLPAPLHGLTSSTRDEQQKTNIMPTSHHLGSMRTISQTIGLLLTHALLLGACAITPATPPDKAQTNIWLSTRLKKTTQEQWAIDCAMFDSCTNEDCSTAYSPPVTRGSPPYDEWVKLTNVNPYKVYQIRLRLRKITSDGGANQRPEFRCRTGVVTLCPKGMQHFTSPEKPWLTIQLSDELSLDGPNVLISKGFTHLAATALPKAATDAPVSTVQFKNVNGRLSALCDEETELNLGPTWIAAKFTWPSPQEDCPVECIENVSQPNPLDSTKVLQPFQPSR